MTQPPAVTTSPRHCPRSAAGPQQGPIAGGVPSRHRAPPWRMPRSNAKGPGGVSVNHLAGVMPASGASTLPAGGSRRIQVAVREGGSLTPADSSQRRGSF